MTMEDDSMQSMETPAPVRRRRFHPLWLLPLLLGALVAWLWYTTPTQMKRVDSYPCHGAILNPTGSGFFYQEAEHNYTLHHWDGTPAWSVTVPAGTPFFSIFPPTGPRAAPLPRLPVGSPARDLPFMAPVICISPNGRYFAAAVPQGQRTVVHTWRDGVASAPVTLLQHHQPRVLALNDGRIFVVFPVALQVAPDSGEIFLFRDGQKIAQGPVPSHGMLTPDAALYVVEGHGKFRYAPVSMRDGRILLGTERIGTGELRTELYGFDGSYTYPSLYAGGTLLTTDGVIYHADGSADTASGMAAGPNPADHLARRHRHPADAGRPGARATAVHRKILGVPAARHPGGRCHR